MVTNRKYFNGAGINILKMHEMFEYGISFQKSGNIRASIDYFEDIGPIVGYWTRVGYKYYACVEVPCAYK